jgi:hypothetical protein
VKTIRLFLVDDEDHFRQTIAKRLAKRGLASEGVEGIKSGAFDYLMKPIELEHLF